VVNGGAAAFVGVVDDVLTRALALLGRDEEAAVARAAAAAGYRRVGAAWWLAQLGERPPAAREPQVLHLHPVAAGVWTVGTATVPDGRGLRYLRLLLARPGVDVPAAELSAAVAGHPTVATGDLGPALDPQARSAYRRRITELDEELDEARSWADPVRIDRLETERSALLAEIGRATGLGGRPRRVGDADERARVAVRKAIAAALDRIAEADPATARLLRDTVRTGGTCRYEPDPGRPVRWVLDEVRPRTPA
jgi:hypothetical protein